MNTYDYLIIGSGVAGLMTALRAAHYGRVLVLTKGALEESNTRYAQGGIAAAIGPEDSPHLHYEDTLAAGAGLCDAEAVRILTSEAPARIRELLSVGVPFDVHNGTLALGLEGAHQARRILHAGGDATGFHIEQSLCRALRSAGVTIVEGCFVTEIVVEGGRAAGVWGQVAGAEPVLYRGQHIVLASGGAGQLFASTTNPPVATGDGLALAYRAGAALADLEFYQFHPTALVVPGVPAFLISEAVRGEGAYLRTVDGKRFMPHYDPRAELAPRDVVSRAICSEMECSGHDHVLLDLRHLDPQVVRSHFPTINAFCRSIGLDMTRQPLPVAPAAHYLMGGVHTNVWGETTVPGLYACGEVACTGVHGANRLASNSLLEGLVFGARIVQGIQEGTTAALVEPYQNSAGWHPPIYLQPVAEDSEALSSGLPTRVDVQQLMWDQVGLVRTGPRLESAQVTLGRWVRSLPVARTSTEHELHNMVLLGWLMATAALTREESRGGHYRSDAPLTEARWQRRIIITSGEYYSDQRDQGILAALGAW